MLDSQKKESIHMLMLIDLYLCIILHCHDPRVDRGLSARKFRESVCVEVVFVIGRHVSSTWDFRQEFASLKRVCLCQGAIV